MPNQDFYKIKYAQLLSVSDDKQIAKHLENINKSGDLIYLITAVINFWMDHADNKENAKNAELALNKLAIILDNIDIMVINNILDNLHEHEIKDQLTDFLVQDLNQLIDLFHKKKHQANIIKFTFLINFLDHETCLKTIKLLSGQDLLKILDNKKSELLFSRTLNHILKYSDIYHDLFLDNNFITTLTTHLNHNNSDKQIFDLDKNTIRLLEHTTCPIGEINDFTSLKSYTILQMMSNYDNLHPNLKNFCQDNLAPILQNHQISKEILKNSQDNKINISDIPKKLITKYEKATLNELVSNIDMQNIANKDIENSTNTNIAKNNQNNNKSR